MIDVSNITNYNASKNQLQEAILFWILAAGKSGKMSAICLDKLITILYHKYGNLSPFKLISENGISTLSGLMKECGIGCYNIKSKTIWELVNSNIDLKNCSCDDLEKIKGIGCKTSRGFIVHTRKNTEYAVVDRHLLKYLNQLGYDVPINTPSKKEYKQIEILFLSLIPVHFTVSEYDLLIWTIYSGN